MTIAEILANEELRRHEFPVAGDSVFLAHAGVSALPRRAAQAISDYTRLASEHDQEEAYAGEKITQARAAAAALLKAAPGEIALVGPTSLALSFVASGLHWRKGDNILIYQDDYPSNVYPWMALVEQGVEVRFLNVRELGRIRTIDVLGQVDENTRLVALASCHFVAGWRLDLAAIGAGLHKRGILFCVDAIQTLGAFPTTVEHVDFLAADAHKWLLGPCASGVLYVRRDLQERLRPTVFGWHNVRCPDYVAQDTLSFRPDGRRYEAGSANLLGLAGMHAAMELLLGIGIDNIAAELLRKRAWLVPALQGRGLEVLQADAPPANASSIVTFHRPGGDMPALHRKLTNADIVTSLRADRSGRRYIRLSPHFYNTDAELARVVELV